MTVTRTTNQKGPATLSVFFAPPPRRDSSTVSPAISSSTTGSNRPHEHTPFDKVESIDVKNVRETEILKKLLDVTQANLYKATAEDEAELQEVNDFTKMSQADREAQEKLNKARAQEKAILEQAKGVVS